MRFPNGIPRVETNCGQVTGCADEMSDNHAETDIGDEDVLKTSIHHARSDSLRDRIAYAIAQADGDEPGMDPASCDYEMADAVIEALKLHVVTVGDYQTVIKGSYPRPLEES